MEGRSTSRVSFNDLSCCILPLVCIGALLQSVVLGSIGLLKGALVLVPVALLTIPSWILSTILHWPRAFVATYVTVAATQRLGPHLRTIALVVLPVPLLAWPLATAVASILFSLGVGFFWPLWSTILLGSLFVDKCSKLLTTTVFEPVHLAKAYALEVWKFHYLLYFKYLEELRRPYYGEPLDVSPLRLLIVAVLSILCSFLGTLAVMVIGMIRLPFIIARALGEWMGLMGKCPASLMCLWLPGWFLCIPLIPVLLLFVFLLVLLGNAVYLGPTCGAVAYLSMTSRPAYRSFMWALGRALDVMYLHIYSMDKTAVRLTGLGSSSLLPTPAQRIGRGRVPSSSSGMRGAQSNSATATAPSAQSASPVDQTWSTFEDICAVSVERAVTWGWVPRADLADSEAYLFIGLPALALLQMLADAASVSPGWIPTTGGDAAAANEDDAAAVAEAADGQGGGMVQSAAGECGGQSVAALEMAVEVGAGSDGGGGDVSVGSDVALVNPNCVREVEMKTELEATVARGGGQGVQGAQVVVEEQAQCVGSIILHTGGGGGGGGGGNDDDGEEEEDALCGGSVLILNGVDGGLSADSWKLGERVEEGDDPPSPSPTHSSSVEAGAGTAAAAGSAESEGHTTSSRPGGDAAPAAGDLSTAGVAATIAGNAEVVCDSSAATHATDPCVVVPLGSQPLDPAIAHLMLEELAKHVLSSDIGFTSAANPVRLHRSLAALQASELEMRYMACHTVLLGDHRVTDLVPLSITAVTAAALAAATGTTPGLVRPSIASAAVGAAAVSSSNVPGPVHKGHTQSGAGGSHSWLAPRRSHNGGGGGGGASSDSRCASGNTVQSASGAAGVPGPRPESGTTGIRLFSLFNRDTGAAGGGGGGGSAPSSPQLTVVVRTGEVVGREPAVPAAAGTPSPWAAQERRGRSSLGDGGGGGGGNANVVTVATEAKTLMELPSMQDCPSFAITSVATTPAHAAPTDVSTAEAVGTLEDRHSVHVAGMRGQPHPGSPAAAVLMRFEEATGRTAARFVGGSHVQSNVVGAASLPSTSPGAPAPSSPERTGTLSAECALADQSAPHTPQLRILVPQAGGSPVSGGCGGQGAAALPPVHPQSASHRWPFGKGHRRTRSQPVGAPAGSQSLGAGGVLIPPSPRSVPGGEIAAVGGDPGAAPRSVTVTLVGPASGTGFHPQRISENDVGGSFDADRSTAEAEAPVDPAVAAAAAAAAAGALLVTPQRLAQLHAFTAAVQSVATALSKKQRMKEIMERLLIKHGTCSNVCEEAGDAEVQAVLAAAVLAPPPPAAIIA